VRALLVAAGLGAWYASQNLLAARPLPPGANETGQLLSRGDGLFVLTEPVNKFLHDHPQWADALLIASSAAIDGLGIYLIAASIFGATMRPFIGLLILFALRQLMQAISVLPAPEGLIWRNPGVPSLLVTYHVANDFFFSGHTAIAVFAATQLARTKSAAWALAGAVIALFEIAAVVVLRAHYSMDVFAGAAAALWVAHLADRIAPPLDNAIMQFGRLGLSAADDGVQAK
jgi:membrane-associated phospholipid phosphatase